MKRISIAILFTFILSGVLFAQGKSGLVFEKNVHDYGSIKEEVEVATSDFEFTNSAKTPVVIQRVVASCGCTSPSYTKEPILPGKKGNIKVAYSTANRPGTFNKNVRIYTNVADTVYTLTIKGNVIPKKR